MSTQATSIGSLERDYARALLDMAVESEQQAAIGAELAQLADLLAGSAQLAVLLSSRMLSIRKRAGAVQRVFEGRVSDLVYRFLQVLNRRDRLGELAGIIRAYQSLLEERQGQVEVHAFVAQPLDADAAIEITRRLGQALGRSVLLKQEVQPELIGGLKMRVGDQLIDGSVATQLRLLRRRLVERGAQSART